MLNVIPKANIMRLADSTGLEEALNKVILNRQDDIENWFFERFQNQRHTPFYSSVDLRNAGYKIAPVDTNLFPAGFNNLDHGFEKQSIAAAQSAIARLGKDIQNILIIPEKHTRNSAYIDHLFCLKSILIKANFNVRIGNITSDETLRFSSSSGDEVLIEPIIRQEDRLVIDNFSAELILLNNDLSSGQPEILRALHTIVTPMLELGWTTRLKSQHFNFYQSIAEDLATFIQIDPWSISALFRNCGEVNFMKREGIECLAINTERLLAAIREKYIAYGIQHEPFIIIKADSGTYGMGVMTVKGVDEIMSLNRKQRNRMAVSKEGQKISKVIIQEGVYTHEKSSINKHTAEPVIYMIDSQVVGGFYRIHRDRHTDQNLNAPGMQFERLSFDDCYGIYKDQFYVYSVTARLALLAAQAEIQHLLGVNN